MRHIPGHRRIRIESGHCPAGRIGLSHSGVLCDRNIIVQPKCPTGVELPAASLSQPVTVTVRVTMIRFTHCQASQWPHHDSVMYCSADSEFELQVLSLY